MGFEKRIVTNTHGDLPEPLIRLIEDVDLDTTLLTLPSLRRYQQFAARFALLQKRVIIGDEMGLGKTVEALAAITHLHKQGQDRTLVICPASVLTNWMREIGSKTQLPAFRLHGPGRDEAVRQWQATGGVGITTFATLGALLRNGEFTTLHTVVVDEAHKIKNPAAQRTKAAQSQIGRAEHAILMTGTPLENRLEEFRTLLGYMNPDLARSAEGLLPAAFRRHIAPAYLRRNQEDVLRELPDLVEVEDWVEFSDVDRQHYESAVASGNFMGMRQAAMRGGLRSLKIEQLIDICEEAIQNDRKVLVFSYFRAALDSLVGLLPGPVFGPLTGSVSPEQRQMLVDEFSSQPGGAVLVSQIEAGGEGLNIQSASVVVICEPQIKPSLEVQAIARAYRMGQQRSVQVHRLLSVEGVDSRIVELLAQKTAVFDDYARESATKDGHGSAIQTDEISLQKTLVAEERKRLGLAGADPSPGDGAADQVSAEDSSTPIAVPPASAPTVESVSEASASAEPVEPSPAPSADAAPRHGRRAAVSSTSASSRGSGYTVIDLETTGLSPGRHHRVLELGVVQVSPTGEIEDEWSTLLNPGRDIPNSHIHGITASDVAAAPSFHEILPRLAAAADGRVLVAHNAPFDMRFLSAELTRAGRVPLEPLPSLCTMHWSGTFLEAPSRKLVDCCGAAGIDLRDAHSAGGDARATAALLRHYLGLLDGSPLPWQEILEDAQRFTWPALGVAGDGVALLHREQARSVAPAGWLERMTSSIPRAAGLNAESYLAVLERALLDGVLSHHEKEELVSLASELGLSRDQALELHASYLDALAEVVLADGVVTDEEREEMDRTAAALGLTDSDIDRALSRAESNRAQGITPGRESIRTAGITLEPGDRIVFTGSMQRDREQWEADARRLGLDPGGVTKKTKLVVAGDPDSLSGKAAKARTYGIPIVTEGAFARMLEGGILPGSSAVR
nr:SNF2-related protein [Brachybacterium equifaecis]